MNLRNAFRFFLEHAGYATPPGRAQCALNLARAEREGKARGWTLEIDPDDESTREEGSPRYFFALYGSAFPGKVLACIGGVDVDGGPYARVLFAELAQEALEQEWKEVLG